jgi:protein TonB
LIQAALATLADPDAQDPRARALGWLAWAAILSVALHAAVLSAFGAMPFRFEGAVASFALTARFVPAPAAAPAQPMEAGPAAEPPAAARAAAAPAAAAPVSAGPTLPDRYFTSRDVDVPAAVRQPPQLVYPEDPYTWRLPGTVRLRVFIEADGSVSRVEVVSAQPPGHFEQAALDAGRALRYEPARIGGQPVRSQKLIDVVFDPHEHLRGDAARR